VKVGETAVVECISSGSPKPRLKWRKNKGPLYPTERHFFTADNQLLIIVKVRMNRCAVSYFLQEVSVPEPKSWMKATGKKF
jgi:hypothetical protein